MNRKLGYQDGYMSKQAGSFSGIAGTGQVAAETAGTVLPYALLVPALVGAGAGKAHSSLTSPSNIDKETAQKALEAAELEEFAAELLRRKQESERKDKYRGTENERTLHI